MILASPFILFYIRNKGYKLTSHLLLEKKVNLQKNSLIKIFGEVDEICIQDNLIIDQNIVEKYSDLLQNNNFSIQRLIVYGEIKEPIFFTSKKLIKKLRNIGVNKIFVLSKETNKFIDYAKNTLGINSLKLEEGRMTEYINSFLEEPSIIIVGRSNSNNETNHSLIIYLYREIDEVKYKDEHSCLLCKRDILELPYSILLCKYMENTINNTENISLAINMIGIILAISKYIFIRGSMIIYLFNFIFSGVLLKKGLNKNNLTVIKSLK